MPCYQSNQQFDIDDNHDEAIINDNDDDDQYGAE